MKRMLFNATQSEELRVAIVDGQKLIDLDIESAGKEQRKSNIYKGIITRVEPSLEAAFINYGTDRHGFLPLKEVSRSNFLTHVEGDPSRARIQDVLREGQELVVQVEKDERGNKGAALTTFVSLAGRYLVLMPNNPRAGGVSRRVEGEDRTELRDTMAQLEVPNGMSIIARTAGIGRNYEELQWDLNYLLQLWRAIDDASKPHFYEEGPNKGKRKNPPPFLIYQEGSLVIRAIRDYFQPDIGEILIDTPDIYEQAVQFMSHVMPNNVSKIKLYQDDIPLFSRFQIEHQIETAFSREVPLASGGAIVIDHTEALVSIDVNSARATRGSDIEHTAFNTNLEASEEIARQLRLRDLGGLVVIDFIDMESQRNQREVENRLRDALRHDRARVQMAKISRFGLLELSRQRLQPSLGETSHSACPRCHGTGHIRGTESSGLHILRIIEEEAMKENTAAIHTQVPVDVATFLLNEKRSEIHAIEARMKVSIMLIPNTHMETPHYSVVRLRSDEIQEATLPSYQMVELPATPESATAVDIEKSLPAQAAVRGVTPGQPAPTRPPQAKGGLFGSIKNWLTRLSATKEMAKDEPARKPQPRGPKRPVSEAARGREREPRREREKRGEPRSTERGPRTPGAAQGERVKPERVATERSENTGQPASAGRTRNRSGRKNSPRAEGQRKVTFNAEGSSKPDEIKPALAGQTEIPALESANPNETAEQPRRRHRRGGKRERYSGDHPRNGERHARAENASETESKPLDSVAANSDDPVTQQQFSMPLQANMPEDKPITVTATFSETPSYRPTEPAEQPPASQATVQQPSNPIPAKSNEGSNGHANRGSEAAANLVQIETKPERVHTDTEAESAPPPHRAPRQQTYVRVEAPIESEPLTQVETRTTQQ